MLRARFIYSENVCWFISPISILVDMTKKVLATNEVPGKAGK